MSMRKLTQLAANAQLSDMGKYARRALGMQYLNEDHFLPEITPAEAARLSNLARAGSAPNGPAPILVFGVMPRSGTNYIRDLIDLHPDVNADPGRIYEFPLLHAAGSTRAHMRDFLSMFPRNAEVLSEWDALALLAGAWMRSLQAESPESRILLKCPHVQNLTLAPVVFPDAKIVLCLRDGRDVIDSTMKTFKRGSLLSKSFSQLAQEWKLGADAIASFAPNGANAHPNVLTVRYEDMIADEETAVRGLLQHMDLSIDHYPFEEMRKMPVRGSSRSQQSNTERWQPEEKSADFNPVKRWSSWSAERLSKFDRIAGASLRQAGYAPGEG